MGSIYIYINISNTVPAAKGQSIGNQYANNMQYV